MPRILIIEDDTSLRRALRISLERSGHEIVEAGNGREGIAAFKANPADLVITDLIMPEVEGVETIRRLREMDTKVPILATSGGGRNNPRGYLYIARHLGANQVLEKPFEIETLRTAIATLLSIPSEAGPA
jgi:DNA-binding response OmpR family regulator